MAKSEQLKVDDEYQAKSDADALIRAEEIKQDPKRFAAAKAVVSKQHRAIKSIAELEDVAQVKIKKFNDKKRSKVAEPEDDESFE